MHKVLRDGSGKNLRDEVRRHAGDAAAQNCIGVCQELMNGVFVFEGVNRRTGVLRTAGTTSPRIDLHVRTSLMRGRTLLRKLIRRKISCGDDVAHVRLLLTSQLLMSLRVVGRPGTC
jgi:hypothetical protein